MKKIYYIILFLIFTAMGFSFKGYSQIWQYQDKLNDDNAFITGEIENGIITAFENHYQKQSVDTFVINADGTVLNKVFFENINYLGFYKISDNYYITGIYYANNKNYIVLLLTDENFNVKKRKYISINNDTIIKSLLIDGKLNLFFDKTENDKTVLNNIVFDGMFNITDEKSTEFSGKRKITDIDYNDSKLYITGWAENNDSKLDLSFGIIDYKSFKSLLFKTFGGKEDEIGHRIIISGEFIYIFGTNESYNENGNKDIWVIKMKKDGSDIIWTKIYDHGLNDEITNVYYYNNIIYITGFSETEKSSQENFIMKINENGEKIYEDVSSLNGNDIINDLAVSGSDIITFGYTVSSNNNDTTGLDGIINYLKPEDEK